MSHTTWPLVSIGTLLDVKHGYAFKSEHFSTRGDYVLLTPGSFLASGGLQLRGDREKYYTGPVPRDYLLSKGDMLIAMTDLTQASPILGSTLIVPESERFLHNQRLGKVVNVRTDHVEQNFLYWFFNSTPFRDAVKASATGATVKHTAPERIKAVSIRLPSIEEQRRISDCLGAYDDLIENNLRRIRILEDMARAIYREWFVHFRFPGHEGVAMVESTDGLIPAGWRVMPLGRIAIEARRNVDKGPLETAQPVVGLEHIPRRSLALDAWDIASEIGSNKLAFRQGEVLFGKIRPYFHKVSIAPFDGLCSADTIVLAPAAPELYGLLVLTVSSDEFVAHATATSNGAKMPRASWAVLSEWPLALPSRALCRTFTELVAPMFSMQQALVLQNVNLRTTRDLLLPRLMSGQLTLTEAEAAV